MRLNGSPKTVNYRRMILGEKAKNRTALVIEADEAAAIPKEYIWRGLTEDGVQKEIFVDGIQDKLFVPNENSAGVLSYTMSMKQAFSDNCVIYDGILGYNYYTNLIQKAFTQRLVGALELAGASFEFDVNNTDKIIHVYATGLASTKIYWTLKASYIEASEL